MSDLKGSLQSIGLASLVGFLGQLRKTGSLSISAGPFIGNVFIDSGRVVGAVFGSERGLPAFEAIMLALGEGEFEFAQDAPERELNLMVEAHVFDEHLRRLANERLEFADVLPSVAMVPSAAVVGADDEQVAIDRGALRLLLDIDGRRSVLDLAHGRGLMATARQVAYLVEHGLVRVSAPGNGRTDAASGRVPERFGGSRT